MWFPLCPLSFVSTAKFEHFEVWFTKVSYTASLVRRKNELFIEENEAPEQTPQVSKF